MARTQRLQRRGFLKGALATGAGLGAANLAAASSAHRTQPKPFSRPLGRNDEIRVAVVGVRGRGNGLASTFQSREGCRVTALCDVDANVLASRAKAYADAGTPVKTFRDVRDLLADDEIDAIVVATPNHWHSLMAVWGCQAGKDVYCEKPVSHNVFEGRQAARAAKKYGRIVQTGTQSRSAQGIRDAIAYVHEGKLGKINVSRGLCYKPRKSIGKVAGPTRVPDHIDYDLWCGPADHLPLRRRNLHYDWHWVHATGSGDIGNQGIHQMDIARWALGETGLSTQVLSVGGRFCYDDDGETPNTQVAVHDFAQGGKLVFEVRGLIYADGDLPEAPGYKGQKIGNVIECEGGYVAVNTRGGAAYDHEGVKIQDFPAGPNHQNAHVENFLAAMRSRRAEDLRSDIEEGHYSSALCHLGNISHLVGATADRDELQAAIQSDRATNESVTRMLEHLETRRIDPETVTLGMPLNIDPATERFVDQPMADLLISRNYREPFVVPDEV